MIKSTAFAFGHCRLAFVAAAVLVASPAHASTPVPSMPFFASVSGFYNLPSASAFASVGVTLVPDWVHANLADNGPPDQQSVNANVAALTAINPNPLIFIDVELVSGTRLSFDIRTTSTATVNQNIAYFEQIIGWIRSANPHAKVGIYGDVPLSDYWTTNNYYTALRMQNNSWYKANLNSIVQAYQAWQAANAYLAPLAQKVDYIFPSLHANYSYYQGTTDGFPEYAFYYLAASRQYSKPVIPFLWPEFPSNYAYIPDSYWKSMLQFARYYADGMLIWNWGGYHNETWNSNVLWWADVRTLALSLSARGALPGHIGLVATPPDGVYTSTQKVSLAATGSTSIRYSLTTTWPNSAYPSCSSGTAYTGPITVSTTEIILATACYPDGSSMNWNFAYVLQ